MSSGYDKVRDMDDKLAEAKGYERALREVRDALENAAPGCGSLLNEREVVFSAWLDKQIEVKDE